MKLIDKDAVMARVTEIYDRNRSNDFIDVCDEIDDILSFIVGHLLHCLKS